MAELHSVLGSFFFLLPPSVGIVKQSDTNQFAMPKVEDIPFIAIEQQQQHETLSISVWFLILHILTHP